MPGSDAGKSLQPLLDIAMSKIPKELHSQTPIALYASAGLRLIDAKASNHILEEARPSPMGQRKHRTFV